VVNLDPDLADESISANLASINTSDHNNITNNTDIRQKMTTTPTRNSHTLDRRAKRARIQVSSQCSILVASFSKNGRPNPYLFMLTLDLKKELKSSLKWLGYSTTQREVMMRKLWKTHGLDEVCSGECGPQIKDAGTM
jgi:hypothetical protein